MKSEIAIRPETNTDTGAITEVTVAAFETLEVSNHTEQFIIEALRNAPSFHPDSWPDMNEKEWAEKVHDHYNVTPYWGV